MPISATDCFQPAFDHTKRVLFAPARVGQWARFGLVSLLAGDISGSTYGCQWPGNTAPSSAGPPSPGGMPAVTAWLSEYAWIIAIAVLGLVLIAIAFMAVSSVCRFILLESVVVRHCAIRRGWRRWQAPGLRYFLFQLSLAAVSAVVVVAILGGAIWLVMRGGWFVDPAAHVLDFLSVIFGAFLLLAIVVVPMAVVGVIAKDFVVPVMALEGLGFIAAWRRARTIIWPSWKPMAIYMVIKALLAIAGAILFAMIGLVAIALTVVVLLGIGAIAGLAGAAIGFTWNAVSWIVVGVGVAIAGAVVLAVVTIVTTPKAVFFTAFSIHWVADRYPPLAAWMRDSMTPPV